MSRRIYRCATQFSESALLNVCIAEEIIIEPNADLGVIEDKHFLLLGEPKRELRVGLGCKSWGTLSPYPRYDLAEWTGALAAIDTTLVPTIDDLFIGWLDPTNFNVRPQNENRLVPALATSNAPENVEAFPGIKLLLVGDTHHGLNSLRNAVTYCKTQRYDVVLLCHQSAHIDFFRAAIGNARVFHFRLHVCPELLQMQEKRRLPLDKRDNQQLTFFGNFSFLHPKRSATLRNLSATATQTIEFLDFRHIPHAPLTEWTSALCDVAFAVCGCLNNQISINQIYSMFAGSLVFSDYFHQGNGWGKLLKDGEHFIFYETVDELIELYRYYADRPEQASAIAHRGQACVEEQFGFSNASNGWLIEQSALAMRDKLRLSTTNLEQLTQHHVKWTDADVFESDMHVYQILHDAAIFFTALIWVTKPDESGSLVEAVRQQIPSCVIASKLHASMLLPGLPAIITRLPEHREMLAMQSNGALYLMIICSMTTDQRQQLEQTVGNLKGLAFHWLGSTVQRNNMAIHYVAPETSNAEWSLPPDCFAALIYSPAALESLAPIY